MNISNHKLNLYKSSYPQDNYLRNISDKYIQVYLYNYH